MARAKCSTCSAIIDGGPGMDQVDVNKKMAEHVEANHANKSEAIFATLQGAKEFVFAVANGSVPTRKVAKALLTDISKCLSEPLPEGLEDDSTSTSTDGASQSGAPDAQTAGTGNGKDAPDANPGKGKGKGK